MGIAANLEHEEDEEQDEGCKNKFLSVCRHTMTHTVFYLIHLHHLCKINANSSISEPFLAYLGILDMNCILILSVSIKNNL